jgi:hypothetical protein
MREAKPLLGDGFASRIASAALPPCALPSRRAPVPPRPATRGGSGGRAGRVGGRVGAAYGTVTPDSSTGPSVGLSSVSCETPGGAIVSITYGTLAGLYEQIGAVLPDAQTPNV